MTVFQVVPDDLREAAGQVESVKGTVAQIQSASSQATSLSPAAFGILCSFFTAPCLAMSNQAHQSMTEISTVLGVHGPALEAIASDFETTDNKVAELHTKLAGSF